MSRRRLLAVFVFLLTAPCCLGFSFPLPRRIIANKRNGFSQTSPVLPFSSRSTQRFSSKTDSVKEKQNDQNLQIGKTEFSAVDGLIALPILLFMGASYFSVDSGFDPGEMIRSIDFQTVIDNTADKIEAMGPMGYVYFSAVYITAEVLALPAVPLTASAGYLFGAIPGTATVLTSATIAAAISFLLGRTFLRSWVVGIVEDNPTLKAIDSAVGKEGFKIVLLLRLSPLLPFALSNYFYGITAVDFWPYLLATFLGFAPGTFAYVSLGQAAQSVSEGPSDTGLPWYGYVVAALVLGALSKVISDVASEALSGLEDE